jgi:hypothetical protein
MSTPSEQQEIDTAAQHLRDLLVRLLVEASASDPRLLQAGGVLDPGLKDALARRDAGFRGEIARIEQELAALRQQLQQSPGRAQEQAGRDELARSLQHVRGEVVVLAEQVERLARSVSALRGGTATAAWAGPGGARAWRPALITLVCAAPLLYGGYLLTHRQPAPRPAVEQSSLQSQTASDPRPPRRASVSGWSSTATSSSTPDPVPGGRPGPVWQRVWDLAVTQPFSCPGDPGASTLLQCACPDVHPAPPAGYPYEGVGERCPPGPAWTGRLAVAALQAVLQVQEPDLQTDIDGLAGEHVAPALDRLASRCALRLGPELMTSPDDPDAGVAAVRVLHLLRNHPGCLREP